LAGLASLMTAEPRTRRAAPSSHAHQIPASPPRRLATDAADADLLPVLKTRLADASRSVRNLRAKATATNRRLVACEAELATTTSLITSMERDTAALRARQTRLQADLVAARSRLESLRQRSPPPEQLDWVQRNPRRAPPTRQEYAVWSRTPGLQQRVLAERQAVRTYAAEHAALVAEIKSVTSDLDKVAARLPTMISELAKAERKAEELERQKGVLRAEAEHSVPLLAVAEQELNELTAQHNSLAKRLPPAPTRPTVVRQASHAVASVRGAATTKPTAAPPIYYGTGFAPDHAGGQRRAFDHLPHGLRMVLLAELAGVDCGIGLAEDLGLGDLKEELRVELEEGLGLQLPCTPCDDHRELFNALDFQLPEFR
jgi:predicted  nucleic acid-binding Zn-ribbon protein